MGGLQGSERPVNWCLCGFAIEASKVQMLPAAERALDLQDPWVVGRCEGLPVCVGGGGVEIPSPHLKEHTALEVPLSRFQGSPGHSVSSPGPAGGSQRVQPLAVIRSSPGSRARDAARRAGGAFGGRGRLKVLLAHLAQLGALAFLPPRFCSHSCVHSARDPPSDP